MSTTYPPVTLPGTEVRLLHSANVDQEYKLFIALPMGYDETEDRYPVLYVTDANLLFGNAPLLRLPVLPMIVVGIGYPTDNRADIVRLRARDFLPTQNKEEEEAFKEEHQMPIESGGGSAFLSFMRDELFAFIDAEYRTRPDDRTLLCYSFGGTFGIYTLFKQPDTFKRYIIGAPGLWWDQEVCFRYEEEYAAQQADLPIKLYLSVGTLDEDVLGGMASKLFRFHTILKSRNYPGLDMKFEVFDGETHATAVAPTISRGLRAVFS